MNLISQLIHFTFRSDLRNGIHRNHPHPYVGGFGKYLCVSVSIETVVHVLAIQRVRKGPSENNNWRRCWTQVAEWPWRQQFSDNWGKSYHSSTQKQWNVHLLSLVCWRHGHSATWDTDGGCFKAGGLYWALIRAGPVYTHRVGTGLVSRA